jgi:hypothetical protein
LNKITYSFIKNILIVIFILLLQVLFYFFFIKPAIIEWGASKQEVSMEMVGDNEKFEITSTRAILINTPNHIVWKWLMQLGANKQGFYSYDLIEQKFENRKTNLNKHIIKNFKVGDIIPGSIEKESSLSTYSFKVLYIKAEESLFLENWGTFLLKSINEKQTRLIIRTQEIRSTNLLTIFKNDVMIPFHFIMERQMLFGLKLQSEQTGYAKLSHNKDILWLVTVFVSLCLIVLLFFIVKSVVIRILISTFLGFLWMYIVFILDPIPLYSTSLAFVIFLIVVNRVRINMNKNRKIID